MHRDNQYLKQLQSLPLYLKVSLTKDRIRQWYKEYNRQVYISFSGGKDSTVLLHIARQLYSDIPVVYIDTGLEYSSIREFVKTFDGVELVKPKKSFREVILKYVYPVISKEQSAFIYEYRHAKSEKIKDIRMNGNRFGMGKIADKYKFLLDAPFEISDLCCDYSKKKPALDYEKRTGRKPIIATMAEESMQRKSNWIKYGCNAFQKKRPTSNPMSFWTEQDALQYIVENNLQIADVYGDIVEGNDGIKGQMTIEDFGLGTLDKCYSCTGVSRTGCCYCLYGAHRPDENKLVVLKEKDRNLYDYVMKPVNNGGLGY